MLHDVITLEQPFYFKVVFLCVFPVYYRDCPFSRMAGCSGLPCLAMIIRKSSILYRYSQGFGVLKVPGHAVGPVLCLLFVWIAYLPHRDIVLCVLRIRCA